MAPNGVLELREITTLIRCLILAASCFGYLLWLTRNMRCEFAIGVLFSGIGGLLFLVGMDNLLKEGALLICLGGLILCLRERHRICRNNLLTPGTLFFAAASVFFFFLLKGSRFTHYDNFSHWARVVGVLLKRNAFPSFLDSNIFFSAYPTGSAAFIYYVAKVTGIHEEWLQMWAQACLMAGLCAGLFAFGNSKGKRILILGGVVVLLAGNTNFTDLLVDTLLPVTALSAMAFCVYYREDIPAKLPFLLPWLVFLVGVKNSGVLFAVLILFYVFLCIHPKQQSLALKRWLIICLVPFFALLLWEKHVSQVFVYGVYAKHAMTLSNYKTVFFSKAPQVLITTLVVFAKTFFLDGTGSWLFFLTAAAMLLLCKKQGQKDGARAVLLVALISYFVYMLGMLGMFLFSMPDEEALRLAGYGRYQRTILIFVWGLLLIAFSLQDLHFHRGQRQRLWKIARGLLAIVLMVSAIKPHFSHYQRQDLSGTDRAHLDSLIETYNIPTGKTYLFLVSDQRQDSGLLDFLAGYLLDSENYIICTPTTVEEPAPEAYEYVILYEDTPECRAFFENRFGESSGLVVENDWETVLEVRKQAGFEVE